MKKPRPPTNKAAFQEASSDPQPPPAIGSGRQAQIDFSVVKERAEPHIEEILQRLAPDGELQGSEYVMYNPHRNDGSLGSFKYNVDKNVYSDFADDEVKGSDIVSLTGYMKQLKPKAAAEDVLRMVDEIENDILSNVAAVSKSTARKKLKKPATTAVVPVPKDAPTPSEIHWQFGRPSVRYSYVDEKGRLVCYIDRFDPPGQKKEIRPLTYRKDNSGKQFWDWLGLTTSRPLYNLYELTERPDVGVVIVEGEKSADAAKQLFPGLVVVTTMHGAESPEKTDFKPLKGRPVLIWPDNDAAGESYVKNVCELLFAQNPTADISVLAIPDVSPEVVEGKATLKPGFVAPVGWDAADAVEEGWTAEHVALLPDNSFLAVPRKKSPLAAASNTPETTVVINMPDHVVDYLESTFGDNLLYTNGSFFAYTRGHWRQLDDLADVRHSIARYYGKSATPKAIDSMFSLLQAFRAVTEANFAPDKRMICMRNGTLNTDTYQLVDHSPDHGLINALDIAWDQAATCPRWLQFLDEIFVNDADKLQKVAFLQQWFGYCLTPDMNQHKFVWMVGAGGNGKSVLLAILEALVGSANVGHAQMERFESAAVRAELEGKLLNISSEMSATATVSDGYLKQITGGDPIEAERKFKPPYTFKPTVKLIAATNQLPRLLDMSDGFARRAVIIAFNRRFSEAEMDPTLVATLRAELPGILVWAIEGLQMLREKGKFDIPDSSRTELATYRAESDPVALFIAECLTPSETFGEKPRVLYDGYQRWARHNGFSPLHIINFGKRLAAHGFVKVRSAVGDYWKVEMNYREVSHLDGLVKLSTEVVDDEKVNQAIPGKPPKFKL